MGPVRTLEFPVSESLRNLVSSESRKLVKLPPLLVPSPLITVPLGSECICEVLLHGRIHNEHII
jgi:hypothetical protein